MSRKQALQKREVSQKQFIEQRKKLVEKTVIRECDLWVITLNNVLGFGKEKIIKVFAEMNPFNVIEEEANDKISDRNLVRIVIDKNWDEMERVLHKFGIGEKRMMRLLSMMSLIYKEYAENLVNVDWVYADTKIAREVKRIMDG